MERFEPVLTTSQQRRIRRARLFDASQVWVLGFFGLVLLGAAIRDNLLVGEIAVGVFVLVGLALRLRAEAAFKLALGVFVAIPLANIVAPYAGVAENLAVFGFLLLVAGVGFSLLELLLQGAKARLHGRRKQTVHIIRPSSFIR